MKSNIIKDYLEPSKNKFTAMLNDYFEPTFNLNHLLLPKIICILVSNGNTMMSIEEHIEKVVQERVEAELKKWLTNQTLSSSNDKVVYTEKEMMELLHIDRKTLKKYRDEGLISYTHPFDKYYYSRDDLQSFLMNKKIRYDAFNIKQ